MTKKKGQLGGATSIGIGLVVLVLVVAVGSIVLGAFQTSQVTGAASCGANSTGGSGGSILYSDCGAAYNVTGDGLTGLVNMSAQFGTVGTIAIAAVLISLVVGAFIVARR